MRVPSLAVLSVLTLVGTALAQTPAPAPAPPAEPPSVATPLPQATEGITRDDYIAKARDTAAKRAATRFDEMDANHDGILTKDEIAAYRAAHPRHKQSEPQ
jgi:hypothetical protein